MSLVETPNLNDTVDKRLDTELFKYITNELNKKIAGTGIAHLHSRSPHLPCLSLTDCNI